MTDNTTPETLTPEEAEAELARLEQDVVDGGDVTIADLTTAKERVSFARLIQKGREARAEKQREKEAAEGRASAKQEVLNLLSTPDGIEEAKQAAIDALNEVARLTQARNERVIEAAHIFSRAGLTQPDMNQINPLDVPGIDPEFYATIGHGEAVISVTAGGRAHAVADAAAPLKAALRDAAASYQLRVKFES